MPPTYRLETPGDPQRFAKASTPLVWPHRVPSGGLPQGLTQSQGVLASGGKALARTDQRNWRTFKGDIDIFSLGIKVGDLLPAWKFVEVAPGQGVEANKDLLDDFFHRPDGRLTMQAVLEVTAMRLFLKGAAHWLLRRPLGAGQIQAATDESARAFAWSQQTQGIVSPRLLTLCKDAAATEMQSLLSQPLGFEWLQGDVQRDPNDSNFFVQSIDDRRRRRFAAADIIEFVKPDPEGTAGGLNRLSALEPWSDASVQVFVMNRDMARTSGMADLMLVISGITGDERDRLEALMLSRADSARTDETYIPLIVRSETMGEEDLKVGSVELSHKEREGMWSDFDDVLRTRKSGALGIPRVFGGDHRDMNRSTAELLYRMAYEGAIGKTALLIEENVNDLLIMDQLGIEDWKFEFEQPEYRTSDVVLEQAVTRLQNGGTTFFQFYAQEHGQDAADELVDMLEERGFDGEAMKLPHVISGGQWKGLGEVLGRKVAPGAVGAVPAVAGAVPPPLALLAEEEEGPPAEQVPGMMKSLDAWQKAANIGVRRHDDALQDEPALLQAQVGLPVALWSDVYAGLSSAQTIGEVSNVFAPVRAVLEAAHRKGLSKGELLGWYEQFHEQVQASIVEGLGT